MRACDLPEIHASWIRGDVEQISVDDARNSPSLSINEDSEVPRDDASASFLMPYVRRHVAARTRAWPTIVVAVAA